MIKTIIVDDEQDARQSIRYVIEHYCPNMQVLDEASSADEAITKIKKHKPDLLLLDVEMPKGSGFKVLEEFPQRSFEVIFITAYNHYAIKAIKFSAVDYILKPVDIDEFIEAANRIEKALNSHRTGNNKRYNVLFENLRAQLPNKLAIPVSEGYQMIYPGEIIRIEADGSYSSIILEKGKSIVVSKSIKEYEELLNGHNFFRIHNSFLVNLEHVKKYLRVEGGYIEMSDGKTINISRRKKEQFLDIIQHFLD